MILFFLFLKGGIIMEFLKAFTYISVITVSITWTAVAIIVIIKLHGLNSVKDQTINKIDQSLSDFKEATDKVTNTFDKASKAMSNIFKGL